MTTRRNKHWKLEIGNWKLPRLGFTLVELLVSLSITAIIMVGLSAFFASSFHNVYQTQENLTATQGQFVVNEIIRDKLANLEKLFEYDANHVVFQNKTKEGVLPFTYIGKSTGNLVFKDFFMFKGMIGGTPSTSYDVKNPAGITQVGLTYYVVAPLENKIYECTGTGAGNCPNSIEGDFKNPIGITTDNTNLFVTDAGNNRIVKIDVATSSIIDPPVAQNLNFPAGIDYYKVGTDEYLFFSEPYKNKVYRLKIGDTEPMVVVGDGDNEACDNSALYCKLNFPTGVFADDTAIPPSLYIADTGNKRILKMSDPVKPANTPPNENISFTFDADIAVEKIAFGNFSGESYVSSSMEPPSGSLNATYSNSTHEMTTGSILNAYENVGCSWTLNGGSTLYTNTDPNGLVDIGDKIALEDNGNMKIYTVTGMTPTRLKCPNPTPPPLFLDQTFAVYLDGNMTSVSSGTQVYFAAKNGNAENILLNFSSATFPTTGFQNIDINVYEFGNTTPVKTYKHFVRVGNGILGTSEDLIAVVQSGLTYPTGVSWNGSLQVGDGVAFNTTGTTFDYTSDFTIDSMAFKKLNSNKILEATITAGGQEYITNAALP